MPLPKTGTGAPTGTPEDAERQGADKQRSIRRQNEAADALAHAGYTVEFCPEVVTSDRLGSTKDDPDYRIEGLIFDCYAPLSTLPSNPLIAFNELSEEDRQKIGPEMRKIISLYSAARIEQREHDVFDEFDDDISDTSYHEEYQKAKLAYALAHIHTHIRSKVKSGQTRNIVVNLTDSICNSEQLRNHLFDYRISQLENVIIIKAQRSAVPVQTFHSKEKNYGIYAPEDFMVHECNCNFT